MPDYSFYTDVYIGVLIPESEYARLASHAEDSIVRLESEYTVQYKGVGRSKAVCAIAEEIFKTEKAVSSALEGLSGEGGAVAGRSIGSVSVSYVQTDASAVGVSLTEAEQFRRHYDVLRRYAVVYRGARCGVL